AAPPTGPAKPRAPADSIHLFHAALSASRDLNFVADAARQRLCLARRLMGKFGEQSRYVRQSDNVIGLGAVQDRQRHFGEGRIFGVLNYRYATGVPDGPQAGSAPKVPVRTTPIVRGPQHTAAERSIGSTVVRALFSRGPSPSDSRSPSSRRCRSGGAI